MQYINESSRARRGPTSRGNKAQKIAKMVAAKALKRSVQLLRTTPNATVTNDTLAPPPDASESDKQKEMEDAALENPRTDCETSEPGPSGSRDPKVSTSERKLQYFSKERIPSTEPSSEGPSYFLVDPNELVKLFEILQCPECASKDLRVAVGEVHKGFCESMNLFCVSCAKTVKTVFSSSRIESTSQRPPFHVNKKMVEFFVSLGLGHAGMEKMCMTMNIPVMSRATFSVHLDLLSKESELFCNEMLGVARKVVRETYVTINPELADEPVIEGTVSYDGSWQRRGFSSNYGLGFVIEVLTGLVVDFVILSKLCVECEKSVSIMGRDTPEFDYWFSKHKPNCEKNYSGTSPAMERSAAEILWRRSVQNCGMKYTVMIGDGDTKTVNWLNNQEVPIYEGVVIQKLECVNHLDKRLGTAIRNLVSDRRKLETERKKQEKAKEDVEGDKGKKRKTRATVAEKKKKEEENLSLSGGKGGNLSDGKIKQLQSYYRNAVVSNIPHVNKMQSAVMAPLEHYASTDENPRHHLCPMGVTSWCWYNKAHAEAEDSEDEFEAPSHEDHPPIMNTKVIDALRPIYERMSNVDLMSKCVHGGTSNANEALHHCVWNRCPKHKFQSRKKLEVAVTYAVSEFNMGCAASLRMRNELFNEYASEASERVSEQRDKERVRQSNVSIKPGANYKRKAVRKERQESEKKKARKEGVSYGAGLAGIEDDEDGEEEKQEEEQQAQEQPKKSLAKSKKKSTTKPKKKAAADSSKPSTVKSAPQPKKKLTAKTSKTPLSKPNAKTSKKKK